MGTTARRMRPVMVAVDGSGDGLRALRYAVQEATRLDSVLRIVHVQQQMVLMAPMMPLVPDPTLHEVAAQIVKEAEAQAREFGYGRPELESVLATGPRNSALLESAADVSCVVVGRRSSPLQHLVGGSTTSSLAAHATVPVVSVPEGWRPLPPRGVVAVGLDDSDYSADVLRAAWSAARSRGARLAVVHAWRPLNEYDVAIGTRALADAWTEATRTSLVRWVRDNAPDAELEWTVLPRYETATVALHEISEAADLLVLGRHGHGRRHGPGLGLGSTVRTMLRAGDCPVMVIPS